MNKINDNLNSNEGLNSIIENYIVAKGVSYILECIKGGDNMYSVMFELINNELNTLITDSLVLKKIEIKGNKVKFVFLQNNRLTVKRNYELDLLGTKPMLKFKNEKVKPYTDKYFR